MSILFVLVKRELKNWFLSAVFYSHCILFSFFALAAMFLLSGFLEANEAELSYSFFRWLPWIFALTAPVIGIRSWSEENHCGMFEVMGTQPIGMNQLVLAKALSAFVVVAIALICTLPAVITVLILGEPDIGIIFSGYIGAFLCGCAFATVSQAVSVYMRVSIGSFVCSVALCLILVTCGTTKIANIILGTFPNLEWMTQLLSAVSITPKYEPFYEGRIEISSLLGFILLIVISIFISQRALLRPRGGARKYRFTKRIFIYGMPVWFSIGIYALFAFSGSYLPGRLDLTEGQRFGLPSAVSQELKALDREITVRLFATSAHPKFGFDLVRYERRIHEMLAQMTKESHGKVSFESLDPNLDPRAARIAAIDEVRSFNFDNADPFMFGIVIESVGRKRVFDFIDPSRERHFLSDLVQAVLDVGRAERKTIGVISPFDLMRTDPLVAKSWTGIDILRKSFNLEYLDVDTDWGMPAIIILHHQTQIDSKLSDKLAQYVENGGDLVVLADPYSLMSENYAQGGSQYLQRSVLPEFIQARGITLANKRSVYDELLKTQNGTQDGTETNAGILTLGAEQFNPSHAITAGFDFVHFLHAGAFELEPKEGYANIDLIRSSPQSLLIDVEVTVQGMHTKIEQAMGELEPLNRGFLLMVLQESTLNESEGRILLVSDADWIHGAVAGIEDANGRLNNVNSNVGLMQNMIDFLAGDRSLRELRLRSLAKRPLSGLDEMRQNIVEPFRIPLAELSQDIEIISSNLLRLDQSRQLAATLTLRNADTERQVANLRVDLLKQQAEILSLRTQREAKIQMRLSIIKWLNVLCVPFLLVLMGIVVTYLRARKVRGKSI